MLHKAAFLVAAIVLVIASSMAVRMGNKIEMWYADPVANVGISPSYAKNAKNLNIAVLVASLLGMMWGTYQLTPASVKDQARQYISGA